MGRQIRRPLSFQKTGGGYGRIVTGDGDVHRVRHHAGPFRVSSSAHRRHCMKVYRFRLVRTIGDAVERMAFVGPRERIPAGWSIAMRRAA